MKNVYKQQMKRKRRPRKRDVTLEYFVVARLENHVTFPNSSNSPLPYNNRGSGRNLSQQVLHMACISKE